MAYDEMELDLLGDRRTALFVIISDTDDTFNFVVSIMYTQLFNLLCDRADDQCGGQLKYHVRLLLDEFANIGLIPKFDKLIATIRSREISASIILQSQSQLKTIYKDAAETIIGNCDTMLFLGGKESSTLKEISETLGKETIDLYNTSDTRGQSPSFGTTYQKTGKELMSRDELSVMDSARSIKMKENSILFRIQEAEERRLRLYEDYKAEILDEDEYSQLKEHYIAEKQRLEHELQKQRQRALELEKRIKICDAQMERMRGILNQNEFDEELVHELIKRIYVGMDNSVEVEFKCSDPYQEVLAIMSEVQNE